MNASEHGVEGPSWFAACGVYENVCTQGNSSAVGTAKRTKQQVKLYSSHVRPLLGGSIQYRITQVLQHCKSSYCPNDLDLLPRDDGTPNDTDETLSASNSRDASLLASCKAIIRFKSLSTFFSRAR